jgi:hypothetical protein
LEALDREAARLDKTRSALVGTAVRHWLATRTTSDEDRRYVEGYLRQPEAANDEVALQAVRAWEPWE